MFNLEPQWSNLTNMFDMGWINEWLIGGLWPGGLGFGSGSTPQQQSLSFSGILGIQTAGHQTTN